MKKLKNKEFIIKKLSTENKELYGSVKPTEISKIIKEKENIDINPSMIQPVKEIKSIGTFDVNLNLHSEIQSQIKIKVVLKKKINNYTFFSPINILFCYFCIKIKLLFIMSQSLNIIKNKSDELPNNIEAEQSVIGSILLTNEIFDDVSLIISSKNFYDPIHKKIFEALEKLIYGGLLANPITLKNYFEKEKDELNIPEYLVKITKFSTSSRQAIEYSKLIFDLYVKRELIKISGEVIDQAKLNDLETDGQKIIENYEKSLFDLAEKGSFSSSLIKFDEAMRQTIEMASNAYKNEEGIVGVPTGLKDLDDRLGGLHKSDLNYYCWKTING